MTSGYVWGLRAGSALLGRKKVEAGDFGARITRADGAQQGQEEITSLYEVLAVIEDQGATLEALGIRWTGGGAQTFPATLILGLPLDVSPGVPYSRLAGAYGWPALTTPPPALWMPTDLSATLTAFGAIVPPRFLASPGAGVAPGPLSISDERSASELRKQRSRPNQRRFKADVLRAYGVLCGACDIATADLLDAAHIVDEGYADDVWTNGLPLCPNHHRAFDRGLLRLEPSMAWRVATTIASTVTKPDIGHLAAAPDPGAIDWKLNRR
ncbi:HNH endonuclease [Geodermatophilus sp. CPCC 205506]|uniref:HNH endonuclease n=1 Tax=Geodermatophilus sp. CPCC 205506 TaxID=2936596 RepID=UPI003EEB1EEC